MSARRQAGVFAASASAGGPVKVLNIGLSGSRRRQVDRQRRGRRRPARSGPSRPRPAPIWKSAPSGPAISSATNVLERAPGDAPDDLADEVALVAARGSPTPCPAPTTAPARRAGAVDFSQSYMSSMANGWSQPGHAGGVAPSGGGPRSPPCRWPRTPASSGATGAWTSSSPRSTSISAARFVTVLVVDQTLVIVSSAHGVVRSASRQPPQMSTTRLAVEVDGDRPAELLARAQVLLELGCAPARTARSTSHAPAPYRNSPRSRSRHSEPPAQKLTGSAAWTRRPSAADAVRGRAALARAAAPGGRHRARVRVRGRLGQRPLRLPDPVARRADGAGERDRGLRRPGLATTVALPALRGPVALAKALAAIDILSGVG